jgi:transcriptional regulator with GAF, ATPase, and Fis domain
MGRANDYIPKAQIHRLVTAIQRELQDAETRRERRRAVEVRDALLKFSQATLTSQTLEELLGSTHVTIRSLMSADNFYIALYDEENELLSFPYYVDQFDEAPPPQKPGRGLTEYILRSGQSVFASLSSLKIWLSVMSWVVDLHRSIGWACRSRLR